MIERIRDLEEIAPPLVELLGEDLLGEPMLGEDAGIIVVRLRSLAAGRGLRAWKETQPDGQGQGRMTRERFEELRGYYDAAEADLVDELNLAIERLGG